MEMAPKQTEITRDFLLSAFTAERGGELSPGKHCETMRLSTKCAHRAEETASASLATLAPSADDAREGDGDRGLTEGQGQPLGDLRPLLSFG